MDFCATLALSSIYIQEGPVSQKTPQHPQKIHELTRGPSLFYGIKVILDIKRYENIVAVYFLLVNRIYDLHSSTHRGSSCSKNKLSWR